MSVLELERPFLYFPWWDRCFALISSSESVFELEESEELSFPDFPWWDRCFARISSSESVSELDEELPRELEYLSWTNFFLGLAPFLWYLLSSDELEELEFDWTLFLWLVFLSWRLIFSSFLSFSSFLAPLRDGDKDEELESLWPLFLGFAPLPRCLLFDLFPSFFLLFWPSSSANFVGLRTL